eukprot:7496721-Lingulodinium_polyedra.AAC.1
MLVGRKRRGLRDNGTAQAGIYTARPNVDAARVCVCAARINVYTVCANLCARRMNRAPNVADAG